MRNYGRYLMGIICVLAVDAFSQTIYSGYVGKAAVEMVLETPNQFKDTEYINGIYIYNGYNEPISIAGYYRKHAFVLDEGPDEGFVFSAFDIKDSIVRGTWRNQKTKVELPVALKKIHEIGSYPLSPTDSAFRGEVDLLQICFDSTFLFKIEVSFDAAVYGIKIISKKTGKLFQEIEVDCQYNGALGINSIQCGTYADGVKSFSIFKSAHFRPDVWSEYLLFRFDPAKKQFRYSGIEKH
jgi:hypothetical protein